MPSDIQIEEASSDSHFYDSSEIWVAECRGKRFICSKVTSTSSGWTLKGGTPTKVHGIEKHEIACQEELSTPSAPVPEYTDSPAARATATAPSQPRSPVEEFQSTAKPRSRKETAPKGAGGFDFASDPASVRAACEAAAGTWEESGATIATCSALPRGIGYGSTASLKFCAESLCAVALRLTTEQGWLATMLALRSQLTEKYGEPTSVTPIPTECAADPAFTTCFKERDLRLHYTWTFSLGERVRMVVGKPLDVEGDAAIRIQYERAAVAAPVDDSGL